MSNSQQHSQQLISANKIQDTPALLQWLSTVTIEDNYMQNVSHMHRQNTEH